MRTMVVAFVAMLVACGGSESNQAERAVPAAPPTTAPTVPVATGTGTRHEVQMVHCCRLRAVVRQVMIGIVVPIITPVTLSTT